MAGLTSLEIRLILFFIQQRDIWFNIGSVDSLERNLENVQLELGFESSANVPVYYKSELEASALTGVIPTLLIILVMVYMMRRMGGMMGGKKGGGLFGSVMQSTAKLVNPSQIEVRFK